MKIKKLNIFQKISLLNKLNKGWKQCKKLIDTNQSVTEEVRAIYQDAKNVLNRIAIVLPPLKGVIEQLLEILKNALE